MLIYLASGFTVAQSEKRERYIYNMFNQNKRDYNRLQSYYFTDLWMKGFGKLCKSI